MSRTLHNSNRRMWAWEDVIAVRWLTHEVVELSIHIWSRSVLGGLDLPPDVSIVGSISHR